MALPEALLAADLDPATQPLLARVQRYLRAVGTRSPGDLVGMSLARLAADERLADDDAVALFRSLVGGELPDEQAGALLVALRPAVLPAETLAAFASVLREAAVPVRPRIAPGDPLVDTCGTGSDGLGTFNVSTTIAFVLAAAGVRVAKHGNRAITSRCGSADVLEALGVAIDLDADGVAACIERVGVGFMFAPVFHGALRGVQMLRRRLAEETPVALRQPSVFNVLGPLANPAPVDRQVIGVYDDALVPTVAAAARALGLARALVAHGEWAGRPAGLDEFSTAGRTRYVELRDGALREATIAPEDAGLPRATDAADLAGGDPASSAAIVRGLLAGHDRGRRLDLVLLNAGAALYLADRATTVAEGVTLARSLVASSAPLHKLEELRRVSNSLRC